MHLWARRSLLLLLALLGVAIGSWLTLKSEQAAAANTVRSAPAGTFSAPPAPASQTLEDAAKKTDGCMSCHTATDRHTMHANPGVVLGCTDCHGGNAMRFRAKSGPAADPAHPDYRAVMESAHVLPADKKFWKFPSSANPAGSYARLNRESPEFVRFINPGDLRVAREACGACHLPIIQAQERSLMSTSTMLWGGAAYNNGILPFKRYNLGEAYTRDGQPAALLNPVKVDNDLFITKGILDRILPLPAWETIPPGDVFRVFERGGRVINSTFPEVGLPNVTGQLQRLDEPGRPDIKQSNRGPGTGQRISVPVINITKTRLNDPHLWFLGTNDNPGDYRSSGCTACHVVYANDREPRHSGPYARYGNLGKSQTQDPTIPKTRSGHPIRHEFTRAIPSSQCMVCHMHQPNIYVNSFYGYMQYDYEPDAPKMWPEKQRYPSHQEIRQINERNPEAAATRGKWGDPEFLKDVWLLNPELKDTQFADYHGHGWNFRAVFKRDRKGTLLDKEGKPVSDDDPQKFKKAVHMSDIHLDVGMHCVDCHFSQDVHGNGHLYGEVAAAIEIDCADCHGTSKQYPTLFTSGPAARPGGMDLGTLRTQDGRRRFEWRNGKLFQRSALFPDKEWEVSLVKDSVNKQHPEYNEKSARAKLMSTGEAGRAGRWGPGVKEYAHDNEKMLCFACHTAWTTSCAGCHLPIEANWKTERLHYEGGETRNYATYNVQVVRDDMFQLGRHGPVKNGRITPVRSSSALVLSSTNSNRERIYVQQPPIAASGHSSQAFAPHFAHTVRKTETKTCADCHISIQNDNNAIMAQLLLQGTNFVNFIGHYAWLGSERNVEAVAVTEWEEPQAVIGSYLQRYAYPDFFRDHERRAQMLPEAHAADTRGRAQCIQMRGEYLFVAEGKGGFRAYDIANIGNKGVSQRIVKAPYSPLGHNAHVPSKNATCMALPTNQPIAPVRNTGDLMRKVNLEQPFHPIYHYAFVVDAQEGLIVVNVDTFADGDARNNFLKRALTWNPSGALSGARHITLAGHYAYVAVADGIQIVDLNDPLKPRLGARIPIDDARASAVQFRYLFVTSKLGLQIVDITSIDKPAVLRRHVALDDARRVYVARTYAYVAAGKQGLVIIDVEKPELPSLYRQFDADGKITDAHDVVVGSTNASLFAYVADGANGLKVVQLTSPELQPKFYGFSPEPNPRLIAWRKTRSPALALSKGLDRDRAVDETGGQIAVLGRIGSRPFNRQEMEKLYLAPNGKLWVVDDLGKPHDYVPSTR
jgi:hypothetical protein